MSECFSGGSASSAALAYLVPPSRSPARTTAAYAQEPAAPVVQTAKDIKLPPGDTQEVRTGAGAVIGAFMGTIAGLPFFGIGAIPGALIGAGLGALIGFASWQIANAYLGG